MDSSSQSPSDPPPSTTINSSLAPSQPSPNPNPNPNSFPNQNPNSKPLIPPPNQPPQQPQSISRPPATLSGTWQPPSHFSHFSSPSPSPSTSSSSGPHTTLPRPVSASAPPQRASIAIGVPAHQPNPSPQPAPFSSSYGQHFGGLGRGAGGTTEPPSPSTSSQVRPPMQGMQGLGMLGSSGSSSQMLQRPVQSSFRPPSSPNPTSQSFQGHGLMRGPSASSPSPPLPSSSQSMQSATQPWLPSSSQGKPPLPTSSFRPQANSSALQQRSHISQQQNHPLAPASQQPQPMSSSPQQQAVQSHQQQEHFGQQFQPSRSSQGLPHQQQTARVQGPANQKASSIAISQTINVPQSMAQGRAVMMEIEEPSTRILSKRTISELVNQIDPFERLDSEVEDILVDLADEFVESITTFGCSLAKHRKSNTLEAKDILLHLEKNWNMTLPGFGSDEIKIFRKPVTNDTHRERLAAIKKSIATSEMVNTRSSVGQAPGNTKSSVAKTPAV